MGLMLVNLNRQKWVPIDFSKITYHRQQSSICFGGIMQFRQRCLGPPVLRNELTLIGITHLILGWRALMKSLSTTSHNHTVNVS
jgi:hypothetical protein